MNTESPSVTVVAAQEQAVAWLILEGYQPGITPAKDKFIWRGDETVIWDTTGNAGVRYAGRSGMFRYGDMITCELSWDEIDAVMMVRFLEASDGP